MILHSLRWMAAGLLAVAFFLPLSRCETFTYAPAPEVAGSDAGAEAAGEAVKKTEPATAPESTPETTPKSTPETNGTPLEIKSPRGTGSYDYQYAYEEIEAGEPLSWLVLPAFFWPLGLIWYRRRERGIWARRLTPVFETLFSFGTVYVVFGITFLNEVITGGYVAYAGAGVYFLAVLGGAFLTLRKFIRDRRAGETDSTSGL
ncbi:MAG: hypothetical protein V3R73_03210 [Sphingomonadales bacterium]